MVRLDQWETGEDPADTIRPRQWKGRGMREGGYVGNFRPQTAQSWLEQDYVVREEKNTLVLRIQ
jgi:hypothetical protein